jgi:beta-lactam-binding protein with PASTA domain
VNDNTRLGRVYQQSPSAGSQIPRGSSVTLTLI